jgi:hypothetical protein
MTLAMLGAALLLHVEGWRAVMVAASALDLVVTAGLGWALPPRSRVGGTAARAPRPAPQLREFDTNRALNWMGIINAAGTSITIYVLERSSRRWCSAFWRIASPILPRAGLSLSVISLIGIVAAISVPITARIHSTQASLDQRAAGAGREYP